MRRTILVVALSTICAAITSFAVAQSQAPQPRVLSGAGLGFRVEGMDRNGNPTGTLVVRVNGEWVEASTSFRTRAAH